MLYDLPSPGLCIRILCERRGKMGHKLLYSNRTNDRHCDHDDDHHVAMIYTLHDDDDVIIIIIIIIIIITAPPNRARSPGG
jgi:hypothetical protein